MIDKISRISTIPTKDDLEGAVLRHLIQAAQDAGIHADRVAITNLFVSLKSNPLAILVGPTHTDKIAIIEQFVRTINGKDPLRFQIMAGHTWWANRSENVAQFTEAQTRWNTSKLIDLIQEAGLPENYRRLYFACMTRISPAELNEFFSGLAYQIQRGQIIHIGQTHLSEPVVFPPNMFLIATMDEEHFNGLDEDLIAQTSIIHWDPENTAIPYPVFEIPTRLNNETTFLESCLRKTQPAFQKLYHLLKNQHEAILPLFEVMNVLQKHKILLPHVIIHEAIVYLANSWSKRGTGLFSQATTSNLNIALDLTIIQLLLLPVNKMICDSARLRRHLNEILSGQFPRSTAFVKSMA